MQTTLKIDKELIFQLTFQNGLPEETWHYISFSSWSFLAFYNPQDTCPFTRKAARSGFKFLIFTV